MESRITFTDKELNNKIIFENFIYNTEGHFYCDLRSEIPHLEMSLMIYDEISKIKQLRDGITNLTTDKQFNIAFNNNDIRLNITMTLDLYGGFKILFSFSSKDNKAEITILCDQTFRDIYTSEINKLFSNMLPCEASTQPDANKWININLSKANGNKNQFLFNIRSSLWSKDILLQLEDWEIKEMINNIKDFINHKINRIIIGPISYINALEFHFHDDRLAVQCILSDYYNNYYECNGIVKMDCLNNMLKVLGMP